MSSNQHSGKISVTLTSDLAGFVREQTESGKYASASEVVREALKLLEAAERIRGDRLSEVKAKIAEGLASLDRGEGLEGEEVFRELEESLVAKTRKNNRR